MNDRQRLEAIVDVVRSYLPPDGISREEAMSQIIALVDPLPAQPEQPEIKQGWDVDTAQQACPYTSEELRGAFYEGFIKGRDSIHTAPPSKPWVTLTDEQIENFYWPYKPSVKEYVRFIESKIKELNYG
jgi:hypothetical protein